MKFPGEKIRVKAGKTHPERKKKKEEPFHGQKRPGQAK